MTGWLTPSAGQKLVLGMVHLRPLPGTPYYRDDFPDLLAEAVEAAQALAEGGADGALVQTVDRVYQVDDDSDPARTVAMGLVIREIVASTPPGFRVGVQLMRNALRASLAVAKVAGGGFIRAGALVGATLSPHGLVHADPYRVMDYRHRIGAQQVGIIADIHTSHFKWLDKNIPAAEVARQAGLAGADAVAAGDPDPGRALELVTQIRQASPRLPVILSGHTDHRNAARLLTAADGAFVGSCLYRDGWGSPIDVARVRDYVAIARDCSTGP